MLAVHRERNHARARNAELFRNHSEPVGFQAREEAQDRAVLRRFVSEPIQTIEQGIAAKTETTSPGVLEVNQSEDDFQRQLRELEELRAMWDSSPQESGLSNDGTLVNRVYD